LVSRKNVAVSLPLIPLPVKYSDLARNTTGRGTISGIKMESENERWLEARMAAPSEGTLSRPLTHGLKSVFSTGPRTNVFMNQ
jgi:hypothetical protein